MNHPSEWQLIYHPKMGKRVFRHKGSGAIVDSLFKLGKVLKKPLVSLAKQAGKKVAEKGINKASDVVVKKAGDKIGSILRKRTQVAAAKPKAKPGTRPRSKTPNPQSRRDELMRLNTLLSQL